MGAIILIAILLRAAFPIFFLLLAVRMWRRIQSLRADVARAPDRGTKQELVWEWIYLSMVGCAFAMLAIWALAAPMYLFRAY
jgi:uncharacterized membrane protein YfcA